MTRLLYHSSHPYNLSQSNPCVRTDYVMATFASPCNGIGIGLHSNSLAQAFASIALHQQHTNVTS